MAAWVWRWGPWGRQLFGWVTAALWLVAPLSAQDWAKARLEESPRHLEWVTIKHGDREVRCFLAYPEVAEEATAVVVIHEIFGLTDWVRGVADQLAEAGYIAIAPDLLSGSGPDGGGTAELGSGDAVRKAISGLEPDQITADLTAVVEHVGNLAAANQGKRI
jgi:carboxymethylenebutenolidase